MKSSIFKIFFTTFILTAASAIAGPPNGFYNDPWCVKLSIAYYRPTDSKVREIYSDGWPDYQLELSRELFNSNWSLWGSIDWSGSDGEALSCGSQVSENKTSIWVLPLSFGLQYFFPVPQINGRFYLGGGGSINFVHITNYCEFVKKHQSKNGTWGGILKSGFQYFFNNAAFVDVFVDYSFLNVHFSQGSSNVETSNAHLNGLKLGAGLGLCF